METMSQGHTQQSQTCQGLSGLLACQRKGDTGPTVSPWDSLTGWRRGNREGQVGAQRGRKKRGVDKVEQQHSLGTSLGSDHEG